MIHYWVFDDGAGDTYTVPINPNKMTSPYPEKAITTHVTTAVDGNTLYFQGRSAPANWQFGGKILDKDHYDNLRKWVYEKGRIVITDHFNRAISCLLLKFDPVPPAPAQSRVHYWNHDYTITALVASVDDTAAIESP